MHDSFHFWKHFSISQFTKLQQLGTLCYIVISTKSIYQLTSIPNSQISYGQLEESSVSIHIQIIIIIRLLYKHTNQILAKVEVIKHEIKLNEVTYPETRAPVPRRKIKAREAPNMSKILSTLGVNGLGFGGLKFGGGENEELGSSLVLTEVELSEDCAIDFTKKPLLFLESL